MTTLLEAAQQALEALKNNAGEMRVEGAISILETALRAALAQQAEPRNQCGETCERARLCATCAQALAQQAEGGGNLPPPLQAEPVATVAENATTQQRVVETPPSDYRRGYWDGFNIGKREGRIEAEDALAQQAEPQDAELSAALGWPGGISEPVLDRKTLLRQVADLRAALAQQDEPDLSRCPQCNGPADNGFDRSIPPSPYLCTKCMAEPVEPVAGVVLNEEGRAALVEHGREEWHCAVRNARRLYIAPPQRLPLTEEEIMDAVREADLDWQAGWTLDEHAPNRFATLVRAVERTHGIKE